MIQFIGLTFAPHREGLRALSVVVDRKARVLGGGEAPVQGWQALEGGVIEVRPGEWVRAGSLALKDAFFQVPAKVRRLWGFSLAGPPGWIALSPDLEPLTALRLTPRPREDFSEWLRAQPRAHSHLYSVLSPKDYFRFAVSGALATDVTQAEGFGRLEPGGGRWARGSLEEAGFLPAWFPPVFDSAVVTGRISEEGIRHTGLPGGLWVVAGAETGAAAVVSAGDLRSGGMLVSSPLEGVLEFRALAPGIEEPGGPEGFESVRAPLAGFRVLRRTVELGAARQAAREALARLAASKLEGVPRPDRLLLDYRPGEAPGWAAELLDGEVPAEPAAFAGEEDPGTAFLAGLAQGAYRNARDLYRKLREERERRESGEASAGGEPAATPRGETEKPAEERGR